MYWLNEKYKPRKPKYFNRVHTGYEWNKYNQTHYDQDNPPPKVVQGYKFNIFYPDLMDKETAPEYVLGKVWLAFLCWLRLRGHEEDILLYVLLFNTTGLLHPKSGPLKGLPICGAVTRQHWDVQRIL